jgi:hypothetical protein
MKEKRPQFVRMNASREENPPPREVYCPDYRSCLSEAAFRNFCLDCSQCAAGIARADFPPAAGRAIQRERACTTSASLELHR